MTGEISLFTNSESEIFSRLTQFGFPSLSMMEGEWVEEKAVCFGTAILSGYETEVNSTLSMSHLPFSFFKNTRNPEPHSLPQ